MEPTIGRVVWYRSKHGELIVPAIITATPESLTDVDRGHVPELAEGTVHLVILHPTGVYPEQGVPQFEGKPDEQEAGSWMWPVIQKPSELTS